ncbi:glycosyltransferase [Ferviditalea candida]|uniref:4,4'-diaponeurosporenoate glycosyltransferase n=1 Tax=Ferviditalea candida TaxID=3108399 RepID=A0ABU5ZET9_9BACL|nr:glycosyltransferase [Paenibacillaceae bacterium T2]
MVAFSLLAIVVLIYWSAHFFVSVRGWRYVYPLPDAGGHPERPPLVSVIVAAKEEEDAITDTVKHLLEQDYGRLEIIAVNDRSTDATGVKLEALKKWSEIKKNVHTPLQVVHVTSLPAGWLGKNHAMYQGYLQARGKYLLFTDADVIFQPDTIRSAIEYMQKKDVEHLTLAPAMTVPGFWLGAFVNFFLFSLSLIVPPWKSNIDSQREKGIGIGAFNLISRRAYEGIGTHSAFPMRPDDDLELGLLVKQFGFKQRFLSGIRKLRVEWYRSLGEAFRGMEKNLFAGFRYNPWLALAGILGQLALFVFPYVGMLLFGDWRSALFLLSVILMMSLYVFVLKKFTVYKGAEVFVLPISSLILVYVLARSVVLAYVRGGVYWRGTFYPLKELKRMYDS